MSNQTWKPVDARGNYWGTADPMVIDHHIYDDEEDTGDRNQDGVISGKVTFEPFLEVDPR